MDLTCIRGGFTQGTPVVLTAPTEAIDYISITTH